MVIFFKTPKLETILNDHQRLVAEYGLPQAKVIERRMSQLEAASCLHDLWNAPGRWHELSANRKGTLSASLRDPYRLIFEPADDPVPYLEDGGLDWKRVTAVRILAVGEDYHGD